MLPSISIIPLLTALLAAHAETTEIAQPQPTGRVVVKLPKSQNLVTIEQDGATDSSSYNQPCKTQDTGVIKCLNESTLMVCDHGVWQFLSKCPTGTKCPDTRCMAKLDKVVQDTSSTSSTSTTDIPNIKVVDDSKIPNIIVDAKHKHVTDNSGTSVSMNMVGLAAVIVDLEDEDAEDGEDDMVLVRYRLYNRDTAAVLSMRYYMKVVPEVATDCFFIF